MFGLVYKPDYQQRFTDHFNALKSFLISSDFDLLDDKQREALLLGVEALPEHKRNNAYWAYIDIKQQTVAFYLSTEDIAENYLNYLPIPSEYEPCVPLAELGGKAWAV
ncbi:hypothetical protein [Paraglaciecola sp. MB-3u-78]|jgi:hypothetical protein|uniref:hypothetical protein n=1 Tax=Paraglaciecola sp. MB-3u-78 TaxID=2058332 RepID=UPI000C339BDF|nr:hypothetical protein [Paraglaciecola sp. MB-3u-78]PKG96710.1 hypothetical protein CXF95_23090 [Paraglaciecola sp. MB-3u-78]